MFNLEKAIADWRRQMTKGGIRAGEVLDELESHLREDIDAQLARRRDLVDILAAGTRAGEKLLADRAFGDVSHGSARRLRGPRSRVRRSDRERALRRLLTA